MKLRRRAPWTHHPPQKAHRDNRSDRSDANIPPPNVFCRIQHRQQSCWSTVRLRRSLLTMLCGFCADRPPGPQTSCRCSVLPRLRESRRRYLGAIVVVAPSTSSRNASASLLAPFAPIRSRIRPGVIFNRFTPALRDDPFRWPQASFRWPLPQAWRLVLHLLHHPVPSRSALPQHRHPAKASRISNRQKRRSR